MTKIIAEAAQGYEGEKLYCDLYVRAAAAAGADAVKFQIVFADDTAEPGYQYYEFYKTLEQPVEAWAEVRQLAADLGVGFFCDISGPRAMRVAKEIRPDAIKFHSSNFFNRPLIKQAFGISDKVFISLGGVRITEIKQLVADVTSWGVQDQLAFLYGFQAEPTPIEKSNVARLALLKEEFPGIEIGYMDHAPGDSDDKIHLSAMAMALGADWIEKHLTLNRFLKVTNYISALEPAEMAVYVESLRRLSGAMGPATTELSSEEEVYRDRHVKKLLAASDLMSGQIITEEDLLPKRTARIGEFEGFHDPRDVIGRTLKAPLKSGDPILEDCFQ